MCRVYNLKEDPHKNHLPLQNNFLLSCKLYNDRNIRV